VRHYHFENLLKLFSSNILWSYITNNKPIEVANNRSIMLIGLLIKPIC